MIRRTEQWALLVVLGAAIATRLPLIFQPGLVLTGDECVVGLMARHLLEGHAPSLYFYGQHYGLSLVEAVAGAIALLAPGPDDRMLKLGMLGLFLISLGFLFRALCRITGPGRALAGCLAFLCMPPWTEWSLQARGGYLTALLATSVLVWLVARTDGIPSRPRTAAIAGWAAVAAVAKLSWVPALLPVLLLPAARARSLRDAIGVLVLTAGAGLILHGIGAALTTSFWHTPGIALGAIPAWIAGLPELLRYHFTTDLFVWSPMGRLSVACGMLWIAWLVAAPVLWARQLVLGRARPWGTACGLAVVLSLAALAVVPREPRYLLSVSFFAWLWFVVELPGTGTRRRPPLRIVVLALMLLTGFTGLLRREIALFAPSPGPGSRDQMLELVDLLASENIGHVYSTEPLLQWQVMFYSRERILARWIHPTDRLPALSREVDRARVEGKPTAVVGMRHRLQGTERLPGLVVYGFETNPFFIAPHPTEEQLLSLGFELNVPAPASDRRATGDAGQT